MVRNHDFLYQFDHLNMQNDRMTATDYLKLIRKSHKTLKNDSHTNPESPANINRKISSYVDVICYFYSHF